MENDLFNDDIITSIKNNEALLLDFDGTLIDYIQTEEKALLHLFKVSGLKEEDYLEGFVSYSKINAYYWSQFELNNISIKDVQIKRFEDLKVKYPDLTENAEIINDTYQQAFVKFTTCDPRVLDALKQLKEMGKTLIIVTNGVQKTQMQRLTNTGIINLVDAVFTSENAGYPKPHPKMFQMSIEFLEEKIGKKFDYKNLWIVGDSYRCDINGGMNLGLKTCWITQDRDQYFKERPSVIVKTFLEFFEMYKEIQTIL